MARKPARPGATVSALMKRVARLPGVGEVQLVLTGSGAFMARALPDSFVAGRRAEATIRAMVAARGPAALSPEEVAEIHDRAGARPLAVSGGVAPEAALEHLAAVVAAVPDCMPAEGVS